MPGSGNLIAAVDRCAELMIDGYTGCENDNEQEFSEAIWEAFSWQVRSQPRFSEYERELIGRGKSYRELPIFDRSYFSSYSPPPDTSWAVRYETSGTSDGSRVSVHRDVAFMALRRRMLRSVWSHTLPSAGRFTMIFLDLPNRRQNELRPPEWSVLESLREFFGNDSSRYVPLTDEEGISELAELLIGDCRLPDPVAIIGPSYFFSRFIDTTKQLFGRSHITLRTNCLILDSGGLKNQGKHADMDSYTTDLQSFFQIRPSQRINTYALTEVGTQFPDRHSAEGPSSKLDFPWAKVRILKPNGQDANEGEAGEIVVYDLLNRLGPLAYRTGDIGARIGRGFRVIGRKPR